MKTKYKPLYFIAQILLTASPPLKGVCILEKTLMSDEEYKQQKDLFKTAQKADPVAA